MPLFLFEPLKLIPVGLAVALLAPLGFVFWRIASHQPWPEVERRARLNAALQEQASTIGTTNEDGIVTVAVKVQIVESIGFSEGTHSWLSFYPRRWIGVAGLLAMATIFICLLLSLFLPVQSEASSSQRAGSAASTGVQ